MKKISLPSLILYALCAVIWSAKAVIDVIYQTYNDSVFMFILDVLCAAIWIVVFIMNLKRYRVAVKQRR